MRKLLLSIFSLFIIYRANAQILNIEKMATTLNLPDDFINSLEACSEYENEKSAFIDGSMSKLQYKITKKQNKCVLKVVAETDHYIHVEQNCVLPMQTAADYASALRRFNAHHYSLISDTFKLTEDEDYKKAAQIMQNADLCEFIRSKIDNTKDIRDNLMLCRHISSEEKIKSAKIIRTIDGRDDNFNCRYFYTMIIQSQDLPKSKFISSEKENVKNSELQFDYVCSFNEAQRLEYISLLESMVLPEEKGYDLTTINTFSNKIETEFIINNCEYLSEKTENM